MATITITEAKAGLERLVELAQSGQDTIIVREGEPVARLTRVVRLKKPIRYGALKGKFVISDDFDDPLPADFLITRGA
jgi:prevent-host-death family protein